ncbi:neural cell adhesion molecule L1-like protein [Varroa jacobsoni]|uniref:neural cell adhesion molecule L1-like protein n=1 Tax=Varroa jacobsoni TaxID=62625 RepID=UPI000BFA7CA9|nr:neural cell adhesion molecule L1-like protein [Varroa jacobsoni]XP_022690663.1 neural cell adhesion molecule L1-like protein [Varroa jacobsoni]
MVKVTCFSTEKSILSWEKDGTVLYNGQQNISIKEFDEMLILSISSLRPEHSGNYTCSARNRYGSSHFSAFLAVTAPPHWKTTPQSEVTLIMGSSQKLVCDVEGYPDPNVTWTLFGETIWKGSTLYFSSTNAKSGVYSCIAENQHGRIQSDIKVSLHSELA